MNKKIAIAVIIIILLAAAGAFFAARDTAPTLQAVRENPALFHFEDYKKRDKLHARLTSLFPRSTAQSSIDTFFTKAGILADEATYETCTTTFVYGKAAFIFGRTTNELLAIQIGDWPSFVAPKCNEGAPLTPSAPSEPQMLKMEKLDSEE